MSSYGFYPNNNGTSYWQEAYGGVVSTQLAQDLGGGWQNPIISAVEASGAGYNVSYYSLFTESRYIPNGTSATWSADIQWLTNHWLLQNTVAPAGKIGMDGLTPDDMWLVGANSFYAGRLIDFTEAHAYTHDSPDIPDLINQARQGTCNYRAPGTCNPTVTLGEFGAKYCQYGEYFQSSNVLNMLNSAGSMGVEIGFNWGLWDYDATLSCTTDSSRFGIGFSANAPRDHMGVLAERAGPLTNGNFESNANGWFSGGETGSVSFYRMGPDSSLPGGAATGSYWGRVEITAPGHHWGCVSWMPVSGAKLVPGAYLRFNISSIYLDLHYHQSNGDTGLLSWKQVSLGAWEMKHIQNLPDASTGTVEPFFYSLPTGTDSVFFCFAGTAPADASPWNKYYIDFDTVSFREMP